MTTKNNMRMTKAELVENNKNLIEENEKLRTRLSEFEMGMHEIRPVDIFYDMDTLVKFFMSGLGPVEGVLFLNQLNYAGFVKVFLEWMLQYNDYSDLMELISDL